LRQGVGRLRPAAHGHHNAALGIEFDDHVGAFVDGPDVVPRVDSDGVSEHESVEAFADLADEGPGLVELEEARPLAPCEDEDVSLRIAGDADAFAGVQVGGKLQKVGHGFEGNLGYVLSFGAGSERSGRQVPTAGWGLGKRDGSRQQQADHFSHRWPPAVSASILQSAVLLRMKRFTTNLPDKGFRLDAARRRH
jgi:hypothetical protein